MRVDIPFIRTISSDTAMEMTRSDEDGTVLLSGYASTFRTTYPMPGLPDVTERIMPGAFVSSLETNPRVVLRKEHQGLPLASLASRTLELGEDRAGLWFRAHLDAEEPESASVVSRVRRGIISEMSFAGRMKEYTYHPDEQLLEVNEIDLDRGDVSLVAHGANPVTSVFSRSQELRDTIAGLIVDPAKVRAELQRLAMLEGERIYV